MKKLVVAALLFAGSATCPAEAQQTGSLVKKGPAQAPDVVRNPAAARMVMQAYVECRLQHDRRALMQFLDTLPASAEARKLAKVTAGHGITECLSSGELRFDELLFRARVYETLYRNEFGGRSPAILGGVPPIDYLASTPADVPSPERDAAFLRGFADCVSRAKPVEAHRLLLSDVASAEETAAFTDLIPTFNACLPAGMTFNFSKSVLRGLVAETMYRLSRQLATATLAGAS